MSSASLVLKNVAVSTDGPRRFSVKMGTDGRARLLIPGYDDLVLSPGEAFDLSVEVLGNRPTPVVFDVVRRAVANA
jgi:hypothetical protein